MTQEWILVTDGLPEESYFKALRVKLEDGTVREANFVNGKFRGVRYGMRYSLELPVVEWKPEDD